jgi:hypothetical protein
LLLACAVPNAPARKMMRTALDTDEQPLATGVSRGLGHDIS